MRVPTGSHHFTTHVVDVHADDLGKFAGELADQCGVANTRHQWCCSPCRGESPVSPIEVEPVDGVLHDESVQRHPSCHEFPNCRVPLLHAQVARIQPIGFDGHIGLAGELLVIPVRLERCRSTGRIAVKGEDHLTVEGTAIAHEPLHQVRMLRTKCRTTRRHGGVDPGDVHGHDVGVALHDDNLVLLADVGAGQVKPVENMGLLVDRGLRGVDVLRRHAVVVPHPPGTESQHRRRGVLDRPEHPPLEEVPSRVADQPRGHQHLGRESLGEQMIPQDMAALGGIPHAEVLGMLAGESASGDEIARDGPLVGEHLAAKELGCRIIGGQNLGTHPRRGGRGAVVNDPQLHAGAVGETLDCLDEGEVLDELKKGDGVAAGLAAEAVEQAARRRHLETWCSLIVERAQPLERAAPSIAQLHIVPDDLVDPSPFADQSNVFLIDPSSHVTILFTHLRD